MGVNASVKVAVVPSRAPLRVSLNESVHVRAPFHVLFAGGWRRAPFSNSSLMLLKLSPAERLQCLPHLLADAKEGHRHVPDDIGEFESREVWLAMLHPLVDRLLDRPCDGAILLVGDRMPVAVVRQGDPRLVVGIHLPEVEATEV